jgi:hypothetical protein
MRHAAGLIILLLLGAVGLAMVLARVRSKRDRKQGLRINVGDKDDSSGG